MRVIVKGFGWGWSIAGVVGTIVAVSAVISNFSFAEVGGIPKEAINFYKNLRDSFFHLTFERLFSIEISPFLKNAIPIWTFFGASVAQTFRQQVDEDFKPAERIFMIILLTFYGAFGFFAVLSTLFWNIAKAETGSFKTTLSGQLKVLLLTFISTLFGIMLFLVWGGLSK